MSDSTNVVNNKPRKMAKPTRIKEAMSYRVFSVFNTSFLIFLALVCLFPIIVVFATSLSSKEAIMAGKVFMLPMQHNNETQHTFVGISTNAYSYLVNNADFWRAFFISLQRVVIGTFVNMFFCVITAYPLSQDPKKFPLRKKYVWFFFTTSLFGGGLVPGYYIIFNTGLLDTLWALIIPGAVSVWNIIMMLNFFRQLPKELDEAAFMDGAGHWTVLFKIYLPTSLPSLATLSLFTLVGHWNSWFDGMIYMNKVTNFPLQTYLQSIITKQDPAALQAMGIDLNKMEDVSQENLTAAQIFVGAVPILMVYPFLQKYFAKGIVLGSVKG